MRAKKIKMTKKFNVLELPIYREHFKMFLEIIEKLEVFIIENSRHKLLLVESYKIAIKIFPSLNAGYNNYNIRDKVLIYNKVRVLLSELQSQLNMLFELKIFEKDYFEEIEISIRYVGALIKKIETLPNEK